MRYEPIYDNVRPVRDIWIKCLNCSGENIIEPSEIESEAYYSKAQMGQRTEYVFEAECECRFCGNNIIYQERVSEYPQGCIEYVDKPTCRGGALIFDTEFDIPVEDDNIYISETPYIVQNRTENVVPLDNRTMLKVDIVDGNAFIGEQIPKNDMFLLNPAGRLLPILVDETRSIRFEENMAVFSEVIMTKPSVGAMRLLGKVAEAVLVRRCAEDSEINRVWLSVARKIRTTHRIADEFFAIGTGLYSTQKRHPHKYSPSDPQRDIIWINNSEELALMSNMRNSAAIPAGLQVKVSGNGANYILKSLKEQRYEVPLVYFPMQRDYEKLYRYLCASGEIGEGFLEENFIDASEIDRRAFDEVRDYYPLLMGLFSGDISVSDFINEALGITPIRNGILASALASNVTDIRIIR